MIARDSRIFKWKKLGKVFDPTKVDGVDWMKEFAQAPSTLIFEGFVRVYFSCRPLPDENGQYVSYTGFVDLDRNNLMKVVNISRKPILELGMTGAFDEFGVYPTSVIRHDNKVYAYYGGWTRCESVPFDVAIGMAVSRNGGVTFERFGDGPVLSASVNEPFILSGPKIRKFNDQFYLWYIAGREWINSDGRFEPVYKIRMASSFDGLSWKKLDRDLIPDKLGAHEAQASPDVFYHDSQYHMFFCYRHGTNFRGPRGYRIGYASSGDLFNWRRDDSKAGIDISDSGWDDETIAYPHVFELDGNVYMFYLGNQVGRYGFGMAELEINE